MTDQERRFLIKKLRRTAALARLLNSKRTYPVKRAQVPKADATDLNSIAADR